MPVLGVVGTLVWDTIHPPDGGETETVEDWGGIAYSLAAFDAVRSPSWSMLPIVKVGEDLGTQARMFLEGLGGVASLAGVISVPQGNNRVELFYQDASRRCERLTGGVPGWTWDELAPLAGECDAMYVNFIAGWELDLPTVRALSREFGGITYCDVHSLILAVETDGVRVPRPLPDRDEWMGAFDIVQMNEQELAMLEPHEGDTLDRAERLLRCGPAAVLVTLGPRGSAWAVREGSPWLEGAERGTVAGMPADPAIDPTGCGDVWGMACCAALLGGSGVPGAMESANRVASRNASLRGTKELTARLCEGSAP